MTPRPLHRWKSLWLALFVACFLTWAWWDSRNFSSGGMWHQAHAYNGSWGLTLARETRYSAAPTWTRNVIRPSSAFPSASLFEAPFFVRGEGKNTFNITLDSRPKTLRENYVLGMSIAPRANWVLIIPHWLILLAFAMPWSAFLIWRQRKTRRLGSGPK